MATSSSSDRRRRGGFVVRATLAYVALAGLVIMAFAGYVGDSWLAAVIALFSAAAGITIISSVSIGPLLRRIRAAAAAASAIGDARFDVRLDVADDDLSELESALNNAATRLDQALTTLRHERQQLEAVLNASGDPTIATDADGNIVYLNDGARAMFDGSTGAHGRPFIEVVRDHDLHALVVAAALRGERSVRVVVYGREQRWLQAMAVPIAGGGTWAALAVFHDLTEVRRLEGVRRDFISNVSHELRTPLAGIRAAIETLREGAREDPSAADEFFGHIQRETDRMTQMVEELLELSRIESGAAPLRFTPVDARALVEAAAERFALQAERAGLALRAIAGAGSLMIVGDEERLERAVGNLVANALKFTPAGGQVTIRADDLKTDVSISVCDTGIGLDPAQQGRVFERFYKADAIRASNGTGLGLAIVKHIVRAHGGDVSVESRPGRGSRFTMSLPRR